MENHLQDLKEIRSLMERSSKFISLSGLSGVLAGAIALVGAFYAYSKIERQQLIDFNNPEGLLLLKELTTTAWIVLISSVSISMLLTYRQMRLKGQKLFDRSAVRLLVNFGVPIVAGGLFCLVLLKKAPFLVDAGTLLFYGLALVNASKYAFDELRTLGYAQIVLGLLCAITNNWRIELLLWAIGFGVLHIIYGIIMYYKYERKA